MSKNSKVLLSVFFSVTLTCLIPSIGNCQEGGSNDFSGSLSELRHSETSSQKEFTSFLLDQKKILLTSKSLPSKNQNPLSKKYFEEQMMDIQKRALLNDSPDLIQLVDKQGTLYQMDVGVGEEGHFSTAFTLEKNVAWFPEDTWSDCRLGNSRYKCSQNTCEKTEASQYYNYRTFRGHKAKDVISIGNLSTRFPFLSAFTVSEEYFYQFFRAEGVIGFGGSKNGSYVHQLFLEKKIQRDIFSLKVNSKIVPRGVNILTFNQPKSELIIGGYDKETIKNENEIRYFKLTTSNSWSIQLKGAIVNKMQVSTKKKTKVIFAIDQQFIYLSSKDYEAFQRAVKSLLSNCEVIYGAIFCSDCNEEQIKNHPPFKVTLKDEDGQDFKIHIPPTDYISYNEGVCVYHIAGPQEGYIYAEGTSENDWFVGDQFLKQTYNIFSYEKNSIGLVKLYNYEAQDGDGEAEDDGDNDDDLAGGIEIKEGEDDKQNGNFLSRIFIFLLVLIIVFAAYFFLKKYKSKQQFLEEQQDEEELKEVREVREGVLTSQNQN